MCKKKDIITTYFYDTNLQNNLHYDGFENLKIVVEKDKTSFQFKTNVRLFIMFLQTVEN